MTIQMTLYGIINNAAVTIFSAILMVSLFPDWDLGILAWIAIVPLLLIVSSRGRIEGFFLAYLCGILFFLGTFDWIRGIANYRWYHHAILAFYLGAYFGLFGLEVGYISKHLGQSAGLWAAPFLWVALEYIRSNFFFLALPWQLLGHSQYQHLAAIQIAALFGTYSIGFLIVLVNAGIACLVLVLLSLFQARRSRRSCEMVSKKWALALVSSALLCTALSLGYGHRAISKTITGKPIDVAMIQGNIDQSKKWDPEYADEIIQTYEDLTLKAGLNRPELIIWPETATPGSISLNPEILNKLNQMVLKTGTPLVFGSAQHQKFMKADQERPHLVNSAFLMIPGNKNAELQQYDKIRRLPFAEYLPQKGIIPWKWINVSSLSEYDSGQQPVVFALSPYRFGVTICWENIFPDFIRQFVKQGAQFVINITNEARFGKTAAPHQLLAISVFRAVENEIFIIRCANTGVSCIIDPRGRIVKRLQDENGQDLFVRGILNGTIIPTDSKTFYTRNGDLVPIAAIAVSFVFIFIAWSKPLAKRKTAHGIE